MALPAVRNGGMFKHLPVILALLGFTAGQVALMAAAVDSLLMSLGPGRGVAVPPRGADDQAEDLPTLLSQNGKKSSA